MVRKEFISLKDSVGLTVTGFINNHNKVLIVFGNKFSILGAGSSKDEHYIDEDVWLDGYSDFEYVGWFLKNFYDHAELVVFGILNQKDVEEYYRVNAEKYESLEHAREYEQYLNLKAKFEGGEK